MGTRLALNKAVVCLIIAFVLALIGSGILTYFPLPYRMYLFSIISIVGYALTWLWFVSLVRDANALIASGKNGILAIQLITNIRITLVRIMIWTTAMLSILIEHLQGQTDSLDPPRVFLFSLLTITMFASTVMDRRDRGHTLEILDHKEKE